MAPLKCAGVAVALLFSSPSRADSVAQWQPYIAEASTRFGLPALWIERVVRAESGGRTIRHGHPITSRAGAMGLMQLMPGTWAAMRARLDLGPNPHDPRDNILAGTYYLRLMYDRFGYPGLFAAYNAGPGRYTAYLEGRAQLPVETVAYMRTVTGVAMIEPRVPSPPSIFVPGTTSGLVTDLRRSLESLTLDQGDRRDEEAYRRVQTRGCAYCADQWIVAATCGV